MNLMNLINLLYEKDCRRAKRSGEINFGGLVESLPILSIIYFPEIISLKHGALRILLYVLDVFM